MSSQIDIDDGVRTGTWDIGADEFGAGADADLAITKNDGQADDGAGHGDLVHDHGDEQRAGHR